MLNNSAFGGKADIPDRLASLSRSPLAVMDQKFAGVHKLDQFFRVEEGEGKAVFDDVEHEINPGFAILVPAGARHNIINGSSGPMKLYTLYAPPNHHDGVVHATKAEAEAAGKTTE